MKLSYSRRDAHSSTGERAYSRALRRAGRRPGTRNGFYQTGAPTQRSRLCPGIGLWTASRPGAFNGRIGNDLGTPSGTHQRVGSVRVSRKKPRRSCCVSGGAVALGLEATDATPVDVLARFDAVVIEDSSTIRLPDKLADLWQSCGGADKKRVSNCMCGGISSKADSRGRCDSEPSRRSKQSLTPAGHAAGCSTSRMKRMQPGVVAQATRDVSGRPRSTVCSWSAR